MDVANPALTVGLAMGAGVLAQVAARHIAMPGIVLLLAVGVLLGPDVANLVRPDLLGDTLSMLVGFAVAIILFDGGMNLDIGRLRREALAIQYLVTFGAAITAAGGALAAHFLLGWEWRISVLFGTLVIVTGPTVVTPLLRRLRLRGRAPTILEAEGVLIDPVGAIVAVVALELLTTGEGTVSEGLRAAAVGLGAGTLMGIVAGVAITLLLRPRNLVPLGLENILVLALVVAIFQISEAVRPESGLATVVAAGLVVGNTHTRVSRELLNFKEQLTILLIGTLFVLLAADVRLADVTALGWPGVATVAALMLVVRPVQVYLCTIGTKLSWQERAFVASMAPRGIVAAAVASHFAQHLGERGFEGGEALRALVFLVIGITVAVHGLTGGWIAGLLGLKRPVNNGYVILGANALGRTLAGVLGHGGREVVLVDSNADRVEAAQAQGLKVIRGQGLLPEVIEAMEPDSRIGCIGLTPNEEVNLLFVRAIRESSRLPWLWAAMCHESGGLPREAVHLAGAALLFARPRGLEKWIARIEAGDVEVEIRKRSEAGNPESQIQDQPAFLILAVRRRAGFEPYDDVLTLGAQEEIVVAVRTPRREEAERILASHGFNAASAWEEDAPRESVEVG